MVLKVIGGRGICLVVCQDAVSGKRFAYPVVLLYSVVIVRGGTSLEIVRILPVLLVFSQLSNFITMFKQTSFLQP